MYYYDDRHGVLHTMTANVHSDKTYERLAADDWGKNCSHNIVNSMSLYNLVL